MGRLCGERAVFVGDLQRHRAMGGSSGQSPSSCSSEKMITQTVRCRKDTGSRSVKGNLPPHAERSDIQPRFVRDMGGALHYTTQLFRWFYIPSAKQRGWNAPATERKAASGERRNVFRAPVSPYISSSYRSAFVPRMLVDGVSVRKNY